MSLVEYCSICGNPDPYGSCEALCRAAGDETKQEGTVKYNDLTFLPHYLIRNVEQAQWGGYSILRGGLVDKNEVMRPNGEVLSGLNPGDVEKIINAETASDPDADDWPY